MVRAGDTEIGYDANGNRAQERRTLPNGQVETIDYTYDRENRLVTLTKAVDGAATLSARYEYDSYGRRARKTVSHPSGSPL
ncbi:MAG: hypothetical protein HC828_09445 [Blastochloris sp.]|nr:hypothetical protein [Blastochloris sp.]